MSWLAVNQGGYPHFSLYFLCDPTDYTLGFLISLWKSARPARKQGLQPCCPQRFRRKEVEPSSSAGDYWRSWVWLHLPRLTSPSLRVYSPLFCLLRTLVIGFRLPRQSRMISEDPQLNYTQKRRLSRAKLSSSRVRVAPDEAICTEKSVACTAMELEPGPG